MSSQKKATTLFNLKDEYLKARQDLHNSTQGTASSKKLKDIIQFRREEKAKKASEKSAKQKKRDARLALTEEEAQDLAKSRSILEAKSAIYDKLLSKPGTECSESILVDFSQKRSEGPVTSQSDTQDPPKSSAMMSGQSHAPVQDESDEVHFANVDHGEVRSKGVGFYNFSEDPVTRQQQMDFLNSMRESTERSRELFLASKKKKKQEKLDRLNRLRGRLGLEELTSLPGEKEAAEEPEEKEDVNINDGTDLAAQSEQGGSSLTGASPAPGIEEQFLRRERSLWERRVEELRSERDMEFAPYYQSGNQPAHHYQSGNQPAHYYQGGNQPAHHYQGGDQPAQDAGYGRGPAALGEDIDEESDEIVNFISFVRRT